MPNCHRCGAEVPPDAASCAACGAAVGGRPATGNGPTEASPPNENATTGATPAPRSDRDGGPGTPGEPPGDGGGGGQGEGRAGARDQGRPRSSRIQGSERHGAAHHESAHRGSSRNRAGDATGIRIVGAVIGALGALQVLLGLLSLNAGSRAFRYGARGAGSAVNDAAILVLVLGAVTLAVAYGLWTVRSWGWHAAMALLCLGTFGSLLLGLRGATGGAVVAGLAWNLLPLLYLLSVKDRYDAACRRRHGYRRDAPAGGSDGRR